MHRLGHLAVTCIALALTLCSVGGFTAGIPAGTAIPVNAAMRFAESTSPFSTAVGTLVIGQTTGLTLQLGTPSQTVQPSRECFTAVAVANTGNGPDIISLRALSVMGWAVDFVRDDNADGVHQAGEQSVINTTDQIPADGLFHCLLRVTPPASATNRDIVYVIATSAKNPALVKALGITLIVQNIPTAYFDPSGIGITDGDVFSTPHIVLDSVSAGSTITFKIGVPTELEVDATVIGDNLACIEPGSGVSSFSATWDDESREITVYATVPDSGTNVEVVGSVTLTAHTNKQSTQLLLDGNSRLDISVTSAAIIPGDLNTDGVVDSNDITMFNNEWPLRHRAYLAPFDPITDGCFDLAPRTTGAWPMWNPVGDKIINILDATAFIECLTGSANTSMSYSSYTRTSQWQNIIYVTVTAAPFGIFQAAVVIPSTAKFNATINNSGSLSNVVHTSGAGSMFYSEYDSKTQTVWITGTVSGSAPYPAARVYLN